MQHNDSYFLRLISSKTNYYACFVIDIGLLLALTIAAFESPLFWIIPAFIAGGLSATLFEWVIHVYPLHVFNSPMQIAHDGHHHDPMGYYNLPFFFSPLTSVVLLFITPSSWHGGVMYAAMAGILLGYVIYSIMHHMMHRIRFKSKHGKAMQAHHYIHHKHDDYNYGVTTRVWDKLFNTVYVSKSKAAG